MGRGTSLLIALVTSVSPTPAEEKDRRMEGGDRETAGGEDDVTRERTKDSMWRREGEKMQHNVPKEHKEGRGGEERRRGGGNA